jgi:hypothetical protein
MGNVDVAAFNHPFPVIAEAARDQEMLHVARGKARFFPVPEKHQTDWWAYSHSNVRTKAESTFSAKRRFRENGASGRKNGRPETKR